MNQVLRRSRCKMVASDCLRFRPASIRSRAVPARPERNRRKGHRGAAGRISNSCFERIVAGHRWQKQTYMLFEGVHG